MPLPSPVEAVDLLRHAAAIADRVEQASAALSKKRGLEREKEWLSAAAQVLAEARAGSAELLDRARKLPELAELRGEFAEALQTAWVDALEKLLAGITFHVSGRSPIIEALYPHQKLAALRRAPADVARKFQADFEKRLKSGYVARMLGAEDFAFAGPVIEKVRASWAEWLSCFEGAAISEEEASSIRESLLAQAARVDVALRQARALCEAALVPLPGAFEEHQLGAKPKKRARPHAPAPEAPPAEAAEVTPAQPEAPPPAEEGAKAEAPRPPRRRRGTEAKAAPPADLQ